jgi:hypothetical protein
MCKKDNCNVRPTFNFEGLKAEYCGNCKENSMVKVCKTCIHPNCKIQPSYNYVGEKKDYIV